MNFARSLMHLARAVTLTVAASWAHAPAHAQAPSDADGRQVERPDLERMLDQLVRDRRDLERRDDDRMLERRRLERREIERQLERERLDRQRR